MRLLLGVVRDGAPERPGSPPSAGYDARVETAARAARIARISIAPVKGLAIRRVEAVDVGPNGVLSPLPSITA